KILSANPFSTPTASRHRSLSRGSLFCSHLRECNAVHKSFRLIREIDKLSDHLRQIHNKAQVALTRLRKNADKLSLAHDSDVAPADHQASLRERLVHVLVPTEKIYDLPPRGGRHTGLSQRNGNLQRDQITDVVNPFGASAS